MLEILAGRRAGNSTCPAQFGACLWRLGNVFVSSCATKNMKKPGTLRYDELPKIADSGERLKT